MKSEHLADNKAFKRALNHCRVALATKQMLNLTDVCRYLGTSPALISYDSVKPLSVLDFNLHIAPVLEELRKNPPASSVPTPTIQQQKQLSQDSPLDEVKSVYEEHPLDKLNWIPQRSPLQKAILYPAQIKAAKDLAYKLCIDNRRGVLLRASVGVGKTFMYGQLIRWLFDHPTFFKNCISPWPALIITKASIVEQTRRVMVNDFGLDGFRQVSVINYDALRSSKGLDTMLSLTYEVRNGVRFEVYKWRPFLHPRLIIIDESQAAKNDDSKQAKIIAALEEIDEKLCPIKIVCSSATPFTRVSEAKYLCINAGIPYRIM